MLIDCEIFPFSIVVVVVATSPMVKMRCVALVVSCYNVLPNDGRNGIASVSECVTEIEIFD